jgi:hypothetical protein
MWGRGRWLEPLAEVNGTRSPLKRGGEEKMSINQNHAKIVASCNQRLTALKKFVTTKTPMVINGQSMKPSDVIAIYQDTLDTRSAAETQRAAYEQALQARERANTARLAIDEGLKAWVANQFGPGTQTVSEFGFSPRKVGAKSAQTKADAVVKLRATRKARNTLGKRQKAGIKGTIPVPTAPAEPAITAPAATPAAVAPAVVTSAPNGAPVTNGAAGH